MASGSGLRWELIESRRSPRRQTPCRTADQPQLPRHGPARRRRAALALPSSPGL